MATGEMATGEKAIGDKATGDKVTGERRLTKKRDQLILRNPVFFCALIACGRLVLGGRVLMRRNDVLMQLGKRPFVPLRFHLSDGRFVDVAHPELAIVSRTAILIARDVKMGERADRLFVYDPVHVISIEPVVNQES